MPSAWAYLATPIIVSSYVEQFFFLGSSAAARAAARGGLGPRPESGQSPG